MTDTEYYQAGSVRVSLALIERLEREVRNTVRRDGDELGGILLGQILTDERCAVVEDYQTVGRSLRKERLYDSSSDRAELERALTIWQSDPDGKIRAIGFFRTDGRTTPAPVNGETALVARRLPGAEGVLLLIGTDRAALHVVGGETLRAGCERVPWNGSEPEGRSPAPRRMWLARPALGGALALAAVGTGLLWYSMPQAAGAGDRRVVRRGPVAKPEAVLQPVPSPTSTPQPEATPALETPPPLPPAAVAEGQPGPSETPAMAAATAAAVPTPTQPASAPGGEFQPAAPVVKIAPAYPREAVAAHVLGTVQVGATVGKDGRLRDVHVLTGPALLAEAAVQAARQWQYTPALANGAPVETEVVMALVFEAPE